VHQVREFQYGVFGAVVLLLVTAFVLGRRRQALARKAELASQQGPVSPPTSITPDRERFSARVSGYSADGNAAVAIQPTTHIKLAD
jgi:hypothetical protein